MQFNTAIAALMEYLNVLAEGGVNRATRADLDAMIRLCAPFAPHLADEAWERLGGKGFVLELPWPTFDAALTVDDTVSIGVQVDGKLRGSVDISPTAAEDAARAAALALPNVAKHLEGRAIKKFIYKPGRIIGIVSAPGRVNRMNRAALMLAIVAATAPAACGGGSSAATDAATGGDAAADAAVMSCDPYAQNCPAGSKCDFGCDGTTATVACRADNGGGAVGAVCSARCRAPRAPDA